MCLYLKNSGKGDDEAVKLIFQHFAAFKLRTPPTELKIFRSKTKWGKHNNSFEATINA